MEQSMTIMSAPAASRWELPDLALRSRDRSWNRTRWETLPADGNRYEVIDGVLYMATAPSSFHQWISRQIFLTLVRQIDESGVGLSFYAPIGVLMPGCDPVQPDLLRRARRGPHKPARAPPVWRACVDRRDSIAL